MTKDALEISEWFKNLQDRITTALEIADGKGKFRQDLWDRLCGGGGRTRIIQNGAIIEKRRRNFSAVHGQTRRSCEYKGSREIRGGYFLRPEYPS